jgi:hypothetical protein
MMDFGIQSEEGDKVEGGERRIGCIIGRFGIGIRGHSLGITFGRLGHNHDLLHQQMVPLCKYAYHKESLYHDTEKQRQKSYFFL